MQLKKRREEDILRAASDILQKVGVQHFTIDQVVDELGVAKGTFYKYYQSKDDILAGVGVNALRLLLSYFKVASQDPGQGVNVLKGIVMSCYEYQLTNPRYFELIVYMERPEFESQYEGYLKVSNELSEYVCELAKQLQEMGYVRKDISAMDINLTMWGTCMGMMNFVDAKEKLLVVHHIERKKIIENYAQILASGLKA